MTAGNGLNVTYTPSNKAKTITCGTASIAFDHDPEHQRYAQTSLAGVTFYLAGAGVLAERFAGAGGSVRWTNYLMVGGRFIGIHVENSDETTLTRYFHTDHLGSIAVITREPEVGLPLVVERLSYDAWGLRRNPDGQADPSGSIASEASRGFTGHEHLEAVGLIHVKRPRLRPAARPLRHARSHDRGPVLHPGLEPLQLRRQQPPQLHRPLRLLLPRMLHL
jgi:hypothetical protein